MKPAYFVCWFSVVATCILPAILVAQSVNPVPFVNQPLVPSSVEPGSPGLTLTVNGTGFASDSVVNWNGVPLNTTFVNVDRLQAEIPSFDLASASTATITVSSPAPGGGTSNPAFFTVTVPTSSVGFATSRVPVGLNPGGIVVGDFNNDGIPDLAVVNQDQPDALCYPYAGVGTLSILLGNGAGSFSTASTSCFPGRESVGLPYLAAADFNKDGKLDVAGEWAGGENAEITFFDGAGDGTLAIEQTIELSDTGTVNLPAFGDFNRGGYLDFIYPSGDPTYPGAPVYFGSSDGFTFAGACCSSLALAGSGFITGDFNRDGILDLVLLGGVVNSGFVGPTEPVILLGVGDGSFVEAPTQPATTLVSPVSVTTGDFNGDGILDLAFADSGSTALTVLLGKGDGTFTQVSGEPALLQPSTS